jgi:hypothetical protein
MLKFVFVLPFLLGLLLSPNIGAQSFSTPDRVDFEDFISFSQSYNKSRQQEGFNPIMDFNDDGEIDFSDFLIFSGAFGTDISTASTPAVIPAQTVYHTSDNTTEIILTFTHEIRLVTETGFLLTTRSISLETGTLEKETFDLQNAALDTNRKTLTLLFPGVIADSSALGLTKTLDRTVVLTGRDSLVTNPFGQFIPIWAFNSYRPVTGNLTLLSGFSPAPATLGLRPFSPTNTDLFTPGVYSLASPMVPSTGDTLTETTARTGLETFLAKRIRNSDTLQQALARFDDPVLLAKMPNPTLRAGLISLKGTLGESGIDAILRGPFGPVTFGSVTTGDYAEINNNRSVTVDQRYASEAFALFGSVFTRMALQLDLQTGRAEELTGSAFLALVTMQQALTDSTLTQSGSELSRRLNAQMLARLNSGQTNFPNIGIYQTPGGEAYPKGRDFPSYAAVFEPLEDITTLAGNLLATYLKTLSPPETELPTATSFNTDILTFIDRHQNVLSPEELIRIAHILKLTLQK